MVDFNMILDTTPLRSGVLVIYLFIYFLDQNYCGKGKVPKLHIKATEQAEYGASQWKH